jgi:hypothetical protein
MEARAAFREPGISKKAVAFVFALMAALILGVTGAYVLRAASASGAAAPGHVLMLGQYSAGGDGSAWNFSNRRSGTQSVEGPAPEAATAASKQAGARRGGNQIVQ